VSRPLSFSDITGCTLVRFERADGLAVNHDPRTIEHGGIDWRALPQAAIGPEIERWLYAVLRLDEHRFIFDLPRTLYGHAGVGTREGTVHLREHGKNSPPVGKVYFMTNDRRFREGDPTDRRDFESLR
jgi:hypothetical protein